jgi:hypothetical protein
LWQFSRLPRLKSLILVGLWLVWQFYMTIYMGIFLSMLLGVMFVLIPFFAPIHTFRERLALWPKRLLEAWREARLAERILTLVATGTLGLAFVALLRPYYHVTQVYNFSRNLLMIWFMLPRLQSYGLADNSQLWGSLSELITKITLRWEHQLFLGLAVVVLILVGIAARFQTASRKVAWLHFFTALTLIVLTLNIRGISLYLLVWAVPGMNSIRAVPRIILAVMWPLAMFIAWVVDGFLQQQPRRHWMQIAAYLIVGLLVAESVFYNHSTYAKADAEDRLDKLAKQIPAIVPANPILYVASNPTDPHWATEIDAMLLSQQLGWPTLNGYSGNYPPSYKSSSSCKQLPQLIKNYMDYAGITDEAYYLDMIQRVIPIGFTDCDLAWWEHMP